ncbi:uncharacterized protein UTRI_04282 [Ustilago trichophora]|uniref:F-box domain-containing protein n=1 Tax=Ustilago trichophora TaxID=86804 RepID=A0A5C3EPR9_9BASI|nr:uncharacterized protein UTRI_04282 [Ustilago trichophora]
MLDQLPLELQAYILVFLPAKTLVRTLSLTNHHFHTLVEAHIQRYCLRYLGLGCYSDQADDAAVLEFEAQRPIDTVTAKHTLHFSHFAAVTPAINAKLHPLSSAAVFEFASGSSSRVATDIERLRGARGTRGRGNSVSVGPERESRRAGYGGTPFQPYLPGLSQNDQHRATQAFVSSSMDLEERAPQRPGLSPNPSSASSLRSRSRSSSTSRARAIAQEIAAAPFPFLRYSIEAANRHAMYRTSSTSSSTAHPNAQGQSLEEPLDAYDWAGPPGTRAAPQAFGSTHRRATDKPACYAFQLDPLDSFESLILTLTARRSVPDANATIAAILRGEEAGCHRLRYSKTLAEGLDRVFRDWFKPPTAIASSSSSFSSSSSSSHATIAPQQPETKVLEFDAASCTLTIQPHASARAHIAHPALSSGQSHNYLSQPPLSAHYASLASNERVELTFHCECVTINAARLLATLERLEHDVLANQAKSRLQLSKLPKIVENATTGLRMIRPGSANVDYFMISQPPQQVQLQPRPAA